MLSLRIIESHSYNYQFLENKKSPKQELPVVTRIPVSTVRSVDLSPFSVEECVIQTFQVTLQFLVFSGTVNYILYYLQGVLDTDIASSLFVY